MEGTKRDIKLKKQLTGKFLKAYVAPACAYGLETVALTETQEQKQNIAVDLSKGGNILSEVASTGQWTKAEKGL